MRFCVRCSLCLAFCAAVCACSVVRKSGKAEKEVPLPRLALSEEAHVPDVNADAIVSDTLMVRDADGKELIIMKAVRDEDGEMVASDAISPSVVLATFRNVAERHGIIDLRFDIRVPAELAGSRLQLRFSPVLYMPDGPERLDGVYITGKEYRAAQLRGYERYERYIGSIVSDSTVFVRYDDLENFLKRNIPELYAFKSDTARISDERWTSAFGVSGQEAVEHYTDHFRKNRNAQKAARKDEMFRRYVKSPIVTEAIRLDTVLVEDSGDVVYSYLQTIHTRPGLRKVDVALEGSVYEEDRKIAEFPSDEKLTFYISSLSGFADTRERYLTRILERRVSENTSCYIEFDSGKAEIDESRGNNPVEMGRIKGNLREILENNHFDLDSVVITAYASPEGSVALNRALALRRAQAASEYFAGFTAAVCDTLCDYPEVNFISREGGENWRMLTRLVESDTLMLQSDREAYMHALETGDPDAREAGLRKLESYPYMRSSLYPRLRVVRFDFHMHRKGMVKDTVHTTIIDSVYMAGVKALQDRDYELALKYLAPYRDFNTAVALTLLDRNRSAMQILETQPESAQTEYMKAILSARFGEDREAVRHYLNACNADRSFVFRGSLDPEIAALVRKYNLNIYDD